MTKNIRRSNILQAQDLPVSAWENSIFSMIPETAPTWKGISRRLIESKKLLSKRETRENRVKKISISRESGRSTIIISIR